MSYRVEKKAWISPSFQILKFNVTSGKRWVGPSVEGADGLHESSGFFHRAEGKKKAVTDITTALATSVGYFDSKRYGPS